MRVLFRSILAAEATDDDFKSYDDRTYKGHSDGVRSLGL